MAVFAEVGDEAGDTSECGGEGIDLADLGADVDGDACGIEPYGFCGLAIDGAGALMSMPNLCSLRPVEM